jgi:hypothetical protein
MFLGRGNRRLISLLPASRRVILVLVLLLGRRLLPALGCLAAVAVAVVVVGARSAGAGSMLRGIVCRLGIPLLRTAGLGR